MMPSKTSTQILSRRSFLGRAAAWGAPLVLPRAARSLGGRSALSAGLATAHIGLGGRGLELLEPFRGTAVALCDVDERQLRKAATGFGPRIRVYKDYREILDRADVDAVVIATPDHWHALQCIHACQAGKDVYLETPACNTLGEAREMLNAAADFGCVVSVGAAGPLTKAGQWARAQVQASSGTANVVRCWGEPNQAYEGNAHSEAPPPELDWDRWLGPTRSIPYDPALLAGGYRWVNDLGGGNVRRQGSLLFGLATYAHGLSTLGRVRVSASGLPPLTGIWNCPKSLDARIEFTAANLVIEWTQNEETPPAPFGAHFGGFTILRGDEQATVLGEVESGADDDQHTDGIDEWIECIQSRQTPTLSLEWGVNAASLSNLITLSYRLGRPLEWDAAAQQFVGDSQANRLIDGSAFDDWSQGA